MVGERQAQGGTREQEADRGPLAALGGVDPNEVLTMVSNVARANPHAALAGAVAVGFLLGGGLTPRLVGAAALFAARRYFRATVEETLSGLEHGLVDKLGNAGAR
jgi:hypothetical protein